MKRENFQQCVTAQHTLLTSLYRRFQQKPRDTPFRYEFNVGRLENLSTRYLTVGIMQKHGISLPEESYFISKSVFHVSIYSIVADICFCTLHPFNIYRTISDIKIVVEELPGRRRLPMEILRNFAPKLLWLLNGLSVHFFVLFHAFDVSFILQFCWRREEARRFCVCLSHVARRVCVHARSHLKAGMLLSKNPAVITLIMRIQE